MPPYSAWIRKAWRFLGSLPGAVAVLSLAAAVSIVGTLLPIENAPKNYYGSVPFIILLAIVGLSVAAGVTKRLRGGISNHAGFLCAHLSMALIALGAIMTVTLGTNGTLTLREGATSGEIALEGNRIQLLDREGEVAAAAGEGEELVDRTLETPAGTVRIAGFLAHSKTQERLVSGPDDAPAAVEIELISGAEKGRYCLTAAEHAHSRVELTQQTNLSYYFLADPREFEKALAPATDDPGRLIVTPLGGGEPTILPAIVGEESPVAGAQFTVRILDYNPDWVMGDTASDKVERRSDVPHNPALKVEVAANGKTQEQWVFARFPDYHGGKQKLVNLLYKRTPTDNDGLHILHTPGRAPVLLYRSGGVTALNEELVVSESGIRLLVERHPLEVRLVRAEEHGVIETDIVPGEPGGPAAVLLESGGPETGAWVSSAKPVAINVGDAAYMAIFGGNALPLGFNIKLEKFEIDSYPGSSRPRDFLSTLWVEYPDGRADKRVVSMNRPLKAGGWKIFQSGYERGPRPTTVLQLARDPGVPLVYAGFVVMIVGIILRFYVQPWLRRRRTALKEGPVGFE